MFTVELIGGYDGKFGRVTAKRVVSLPFAPWNGLCLLDGDNETTIQGGLDWDLKRQVFVGLADDLDDGMQFKSLEDAMRWLEKYDWKITELDPVE